MHIFSALTYYRPHISGLTLYAEREARALAARGHQVTILTSRFDDRLPEHEVCDGIEVYRCRVWFRISKGPVMPAMLLWAWRLARQADVIQLHAPQLDAALMAVLGKLMGKPVVLTYQCDLRLPHGFVHALANQASNLANWISASLADVIVQLSQDYAENSAFLRRFLHKIQPVYPPIELAQVSAADRQAFRQKYNLQPGERIIGMAARLATEKGVEYLVEALPAVLQKHPRARVLFVGPYQNVVGEEQYAQRLAPMIEQINQRNSGLNHWTFLGIVSEIEMAAFFHESEVTVLPSINSTEAYGIVQVESMACGTPVVASDLPGVRVPVGETGMGLIVPPADPQALAQALIAILDDPQAYRGQPEKLISLSSPEAVAQQYETLFEELLRKKHKGGVG